MKQSQQNISKKQEKHFYKNRKIFWFFLLLLITLFFVSFSATSFILMNSYRLAFVGENQEHLQHELEMLKLELNQKEMEIEELKLQLANIEGESSFVNELLNSNESSIN